MQQDSPVLILGAGRKLVLAEPVIMGVVNVTPDSFSDGGAYVAPERAITHAMRMVADGATLVDVGGESTRPGASPVSVAQELDRVMPVIEALAAEGVLVSVDTSKPEVMRAAAGAGAAMINDVRALREDGALQAAAQSGLAICLMHMQGEPRSMQESPSYDDVLAEVLLFLLNRARQCENAGIGRDKIVLDPGFGFGKRLEHNLALLGNLGHFTGHGYPVLVGISRKSMLGALLDKPVPERLAGSLGAASLSAWLGAHIIRVHDVSQTRDVLKVITAARTAARRKD